MSRSEHHSNWASIVWHEAAGIRYVTVSGEVDVSNVTALKRALDAPQLYVDMANVSFIDSTSIKTLVKARMGATEFDLVASRIVRKVLEIASLIDLLNVVSEGEPGPV